MRLSLEEYFGYLQSNFNSRNVKEGEEVLNANHLILCGSTKCTPQDIEIYALCLQTSALNSPPHLIKGFLKITNMVKVSKVTCTCKAGAGEKCKHISAVLLYCTRYNVEDLEPVSSTDVKCLWSMKKSSALEQYRPMPIQDWKCIKKSEQKCSISIDEQKDIIRTLELCCPNSALAKHSTGRRTVSEADYVEIILKEDNFIDEILNNAAESVLMMELYSAEPALTNKCCQLTLEQLFVDPIEVCLNTRMCNIEWHKSRKYRITGSRCYSVFTYKSEDWKKKAYNYFWPKNISNEYTRYGIITEEEARKKYIEKTGYIVEKTGLVVPNNNCWLGYSPDGVIIENNHPSKLLEIKCPFTGKTKSIKDCVRQIKYLQVDNNNQISLKQKHQYYGQIQLGMSILNLKQCDFVVYASVDRSLLIINVNRNEEFCQNMLRTLKNRYFLHMLHVICENKNK